MTTTDTAFIDSPSNLSFLLRVSDVEDLDILVDYITDKGEGRIALDGDVCKKLVRCKQRGHYSPEERSLISEEIRRFGGNTLGNLFRDIRSVIDDGFSTTALYYDEIVRDVAKHLKVPVNKKSLVPTMEDGILRKILEDSFEKMSPEEQRKILKELDVANLSTLNSAAMAGALIGAKAGGFATYKVALIVANAVAKAILGRGLTLGGNVILTRTIGVLLGPIGWVLTGLWTLADMASPAYRVTVPCVVQIAYMRQKALSNILSSTCPSCNAMNPVSAKFCVECGTAMQKEAAHGK